jgi:hypothetical protein
MEAEASKIQECPCPSQLLFSVFIVVTNYRHYRFSFLTFSLRLPAASDKGSILKSF